MDSKKNSETRTKELESDLGTKLFGIRDSVFAFMIAKEVGTLQKSLVGRIIQCEEQLGVEGHRLSTFILKKIGLWPSPNTKVEIVDLVSKFEQNPPK